MRAVASATAVGFHSEIVCTRRCFQLCGARQGNVNQPAGMIPTTYRRAFVAAEAMARRCHRPHRFERRLMRLFAVILGLLAALKIGYQEMTYRSATSEVIIGAYRERAIQACRRDPRNLSQGSTAEVWGQPASITLAIGKPGLDVYVWQVDHALWNARFRNPYLFLSADPYAGKLVCEFDVVNGTASVYRM